MLERPAGVAGDPIFTMTVYTDGYVAVEPHRQPQGSDLNAAVLGALQAIVAAMEAGEMTFAQVPL